MSDFLTNLVARSLDIANVVQPRPQSVFEQVDSQEPVGAGQMTSPPERTYLTSVDAAESGARNPTKGATPAHGEFPTPAFVRSVEREELRSPETDPQRGITVTESDSEPGDESPSAVSSTTSEVPLQPLASHPSTTQSAADIELTPHDRVALSPASVESVAPDTTRRSHKLPQPEATLGSAAAKSPVVPQAIPQSPLPPAFQPEGSASRLVHEPAALPANTGDADPGPAIRSALTASVSAAVRPRSDTIAAQASVAPTVQVTIGRVDVRAVNVVPETTPVPRKPREPTLSLDEYARQRTGARK